MALWTAFSSSEALQRTSADQVKFEGACSLIGLLKPLDERVFPEAERMTTPNIFAESVVNASSQIWLVDLDR